MGFNYIFPEFIAKALAKPNERTQMESSLVGITVMMLGSLGIAIFMIASGIANTFWFKFLICASELGLLSFQFSLLTTTFQVYHEYKLNKGLYPFDYKLKMKLDEAKLLRDELNELITQQLNKTGGEKC